jgi:hypothetical protein
MNQHVIGMDWAVGNDEGCIAVMDISGQMVVLHRYHGQSWERQRGILREMNAKWQPLVIYIEGNGIGFGNLEALQMEGLPARPFTMAKQNREYLFGLLRAEIESGRAVILPDDELLKEFRDMDRPAKLRAASLVATALAVHGVNNRGVRLDFS